MPADQRTHNNWLGEQVKHVDKNPEKLNPVLEEFGNFIKGNAKLRMLATAMFEEIPNRGYELMDGLTPPRVAKLTLMIDRTRWILLGTSRFVTLIISWLC
jgi:hypothetical protein